MGLTVTAKFFLGHKCNSCNLDALLQGNGSKTQVKQRVFQRMLTIVSSMTRSENANPKR
jgi:hypothetical protein